MSSASADVTAVVKEAIAQPPLRRPPVGPIIAAMRALEDSQDPRVQRLITAILPLIEEAAGAELAAQGQERARRVPLYPSDRVLLVESYVGARSAQAVAARHADPTKWGIPANHGSASSSATRNTTRKVKKVVYFLRFSSLWWSKSGKCSSERVFRPIVEKLLRRALTKEDKGIIDLDREEWDLVEELRVGSALARPLKAADGTTTLSLWQSALTSLQGAPVVVFFGRDCPVDNKDAMYWIVIHMDPRTIIIAAWRNDDGLWQWERHIREVLLIQLCGRALEGQTDAYPVTGEMIPLMEGGERSRHLKCLSEVCGAAKRRYAADDEETMWDAAFQQGETFVLPWEAVEQKGSIKQQYRRTVTWRVRPTRSGAGSPQSPHLASQSTSFTSEPSQASAPYQAARNPPALAPAHAPYTPMGWPEGYSDYDARHGQGSISAAYGYGGYGGYGYPLPPTAPSHGAASDNITQESAPHSQRWSAQPSPSAAAAAAFTAQSRGGYGQDGVMAAAAAAAAVAHGHAGYGQASAAGLLTQSGRAFAPRTQQGAMAMQAAAAAAASGQGYTGYNPGQTTHGTGAQSTAPDASSDQEISNETAMAVAMARAAAHAYAGTGRGRGRGRGGGGGGSFRGFGSGGAW